MSAFKYFEYIYRFKIGGKPFKLKTKALNISRFRIKEIISHSFAQDKLYRQLKETVDLFSDKPAIISSHGEIITYKDFWKQVQFLSGYYKKIGLKEGDAIVTYIPDHFLTAVVLFSVINTGICVPLNKAFTPLELCALIRRIKPCAIIVQKDIEDESFHKIKREFNLAVIKIQQQNDIYKLEITLDSNDYKTKKPQYSSDISLILLTSATTGNSKLVPLRHKQLLAIVKNGFTVFPEAKNGRVLIMIPHFHIQFILAYLSQLFSGGSIIQTEGFDKDIFMYCFSALNPTHFTGNPTILEAIASFPEDFYKNNSFSELRFIASTGSTLSGALKSKVEKLYHTRVYEGYGLTETGAITKTPKLPRDERPGSVGKCIGPEVRIINDEGNFLDFGETGEIVIKGTTVTSGYIDDPEANKISFVNGWFHTGDIGKLDPDGYLYLFGRKKEMINRGAEKILPEEVEAAILKHQSVKEAIVFPYPHARLGEDVAACIVLSSPLSPVELRQFLIKSIALYKIPRLIFYVDTVPKGPTGKPQRNKLAEILISPGDLKKIQTKTTRKFNDIEYKLSEIWKNLLNVKEIDLHDDFFLIGGDSLMAVQMLYFIEEKWQCALTIEELIISATLESISAIVQHKISLKELNENKSFAKKIVILNANGNRTPYFIVGMKDGTLSVYRNLLKELGTEQPVYGLIPEIYYSGNISLSILKQTASKYVDIICENQPEGPYRIVGYSLSGLIALEIAHQLIQINRKVDIVVLFDTFPFLACPSSKPAAKYDIYEIYDKMIYHKIKISEMSWNERRKYFSEIVSRRFILLQSYLSDKNKKNQIIEARNANNNITDNTIDETPFFFERIKTDRFSFSTILFWCYWDIDQYGRIKMLRIWKKHLKPNIYINKITGKHHTVMQSIHLKNINARINRFDKKTTVK